MFAQPDCMVTQSTVTSTTAGVTTTTITTYTWNGLTSSFTISDSSNSGYITYNTNGDIVEQFSDYVDSGFTQTVNNQYDSQNRLIQTITNTNGMVQTRTYTWNGLTSSFTTSDNSLSGYITYNTNGDIVEQFYDFVAFTQTINNQYDSQNRLIQVSVINSTNSSNYTTTYTWNGLTANFVTSGTVNQTGYQTMNENGYMIEYQNIDSTTQNSSQLTYTYNCNTSTLFELNNSKTLVSTIDLLGKETAEKGFNIEIYNDGSVKKKYIIK